jgi:serine/threonine protein kinase
MAKGSLHSFLRSPQGKLVWPAHARMALGGARGMEFLHSAKPPVIHRDLKSHNFLVDDQMQLRVCDFGVSKILERESGANTKLGTM